MKKQGITSMSDFKAAREAKNAEELRVEQEQQQSLEIAQEQAQPRAAQMSRGGSSQSGSTPTNTPRTTTSQTVFRRIGPSTGQRVPYDLEAAGNQADEAQDIYESLEDLKNPDPGQEGKLITGEFGPGAVRPRGFRPGEYDPTVGDSRVLGENLKTAGYPREGEGYQAHHMVPSNEPMAAQVRSFIKDKGFNDINDADNGVWLPTHKQTANIGAEFKHEFTFDNAQFGGEYFHRLEDILMVEGISAQGIRLRLQLLRTYLKAGELPPAGAFTSLPL
jgi:hypothetical protein